MGFPFLLIAVRASGRRQYEIAQLAGLREGRLSEIIRRGGARPDERAALSRALGRPEDVLFAVEPEQPSLDLPETGFDSREPGRVRK